MMRYRRLSHRCAPLGHELGASDELAEIVCRSALEAMQGHGGESARWLAEATSAPTLCSMRWCWSARTR
jgi:hypothetical protein